MKLKNVFSFALLLALPLAAAAQPTNATRQGAPPGAIPILPSSGRAAVPTANSATNFPPAMRNPSAAVPVASSVAGATNAANVPNATNTTAASTNRASAAALTGPYIPSPEVANIKYNWSMPVDQVIDEIYAPLVERTPLRSPDVSKDKIITLKTWHDLTRSEAIMALETELGMNGITIVPIGDKFFKVVDDKVAQQAGGERVTASAGELPAAGKFITEIVQLRYADPDQVVKALGYFAKTANSIIYIPSTESLILRDYTENVKRMMEMIEKLDVESPLTVKSEVIPIRYALAEDISAALGQLGAGSGTFGKSTTGAGFKTSGGSTTTGSGFGSTPGTGIPGQASQSGLSTGASGSRSTFGSRLNGIVSGASGGAGGVSLFGQTKVIADERTNSLLVFANDDDMKMIKKIIGQLDVVLAQVLIEAIILEVNLTDGKNFNFSIAQNQSSRGKFTGAGGSQFLGPASSFLGGGGSGSGTNGVAGTGSALGASSLASLPNEFSYYGKYGNDFDAVMEAVASDSRISVLSRPQIQTSHAVEAELFIGQTVPYVTGTQNYGYSSGPSSTYTQLEVGIRMRVLPLINPDGLVVMDIDQEIEQLGPSVAIPGAGNVPTTTKRDAGAKVSVMSGETIILGGFITASRSANQTGIPWLMNVPVLGNFFKSSATQNSRTELIVLMRPTVLKTPQIAAKVATEQRDRMAAVKQAELDIRKDEDARNAKANKELLDAAAKEAKKAGHHPTNPPVEIHLEDTNQSVNLHLNDTNTESVIEKERP